MEYLYHKLREYENRNIYPFHMPGHKRMPIAGMNCYGIDMTEIPEFDNLHHAQGILADAMRRAARLYRSGKTYYLVNGSTCGILAAISAVSKGGSIIMARNCHKSVYHGVLLNRLKAHYVYPAYQEEYHVNGGIDPQDVRKLLEEEKDVCAVLVTSPTYDGITSDVRKIGQIAHGYGVPLIVDEAHGALFPLDRDGCESALDAGADLVIHSLHKTLPCLTQTALIHLNGDLVSEKRLEHFLQIYQTSSPSYVLMAAMDECIRYMSTEGETYCERLHELRKCIGAGLEGTRMFRLMDDRIVGRDHITGLDDGKVVISCGQSGWSGAGLADALRNRYHLQMEMAGVDYVVGILTGMDTQEGVDRLIRAVRELDTATMGASAAMGISAAIRTSAAMRMSGAEAVSCQSLPVNRQAMTIHEADCSRKRTIPIEQAEGCVSGEFVYAYPPGIPFVVPGEVIGSDVLRIIREGQQTGLSIEGLTDVQGKTIQICNGK